MPVQGFHAGLFQLALRRGAPVVLVLWTAAVVLLLATADSPTDSVRLAGDDDVLAGAAVARGIARQTALAVLALALLPVVVARAAAIVPSWRRGELRWLGCRAAGSATILISTWTGAFAAGALLLGAAACAIEAQLDASTSLRWVGRIPTPAEPWLADGRALAWEVPDPGQRATRIRIGVGLGLGAGASAEIVATARRISGDVPPRIGRARIATRGAVEVDVPPGAGDLALTLEAPDPAASFFLPADGASVWEPVSSERLATASMLARIASALAAWIALAIGLGAWVSVPTAVALLVALWLPAWSAPTPPSWLPGADLFDALATIGRARVPAALDPRTFAVALALVAVGLVLGALGLRHAGVRR